jgi:DNA (cytosine-5)-methyltransferase 1
MKFGSLFSGIGGLDLGLERAGMQCRWQVESDSYCQRVLAKHWPGVPRFGDIRLLDTRELERVDLICGGFPCQDVSLAGLGAGLDGERSGLWSEYLRVVRNLRPRYVLVENVSALLVRGFERVLSDLAVSGYDAEWDSLRAGYFGAPHRRERIFILAYPKEGDGKARMGSVANGTRPIFAGRDCEGFQIWLQAADRFVGMDDGVSARIYLDRAGGLGNAVVPQVAEWIGTRIMEAGKLSI